MKRFGHSMKVVALSMAVVMLVTSLPIGFARAAIVTTDQVIEAHALVADRARVMEFMAREDVRRQIEALGIDPDEAARRTESLSDEEIQRFAGKLDQLPAGGDSFLVIVLALTLLTFLILVILDLLGYTDVFPFIKSQRSAN